MSAQPHSCLEMWTVYDHPTDYPQGFVARLWIIAGVAMATQTHYVAPSLEELRAFLPRGLTCMPRNEFDDAAIVETWF